MLVQNETYKVLFDNYSLLNEACCEKSLMLYIKVLIA